MAVKVDVTKRGARHARWIAAVVISTVVRCQGARAGQPSPDDELVRLGKVAAIALAPRRPVDAAQTARIKQLIRSLASISKPDFGLSSTITGDAFAPIAGQGQATALLLTDHKLEQSSALRELVTIGPEALPFLLDSLDDQTPTGIVVKHGGGMGGMLFEAELPTNAANPFEKGLNRTLAKERQWGRLDSYRVKVGDVCFVAIGQIVGRSYQAVRYQPTAIIVINSPTRDARLRADVRAIWSSQDPARKLFDSLLADYATEGSQTGRELSRGWERASHAQCAAALRLLYYFPTESAQMIGARIRGFELSVRDDVYAHIRQYHRNGVRTEDFIQSVSWSRSAPIQLTVAAVFRKTTDLEVMLAALPAVEDPKEVNDRLVALVARLPADDPGSDGQRLLTALAKRSPQAARPVFEAYLGKGGFHRRLKMCEILEGVSVPWAVEILRPFLADTQEPPWRYGMDGELRLRVCDRAAMTLSHLNPELKFTVPARFEDRDREIAVLQAALARRDRAR
jgi:hypothetical protein